MLKQSFWRHYLAYLHILSLGVFFYILLCLLIKYIPPAKIAHWLYQDSYLPMQMLLFCGNFFFFTFLTQNRHLGLWLSMVCFQWLFFILAHFVLTPVLIFSLLISSGLLYIWLVILPTKNKQN